MKTKSLRFCITVCVLIGTSASAESPKPYSLETCIVSGEKLGEHGKPVILVQDGQEIKLCCKSCLKDFNSDTSKYLKKLQDSGNSKEASVSSTNHKATCNCEKPIEPAKLNELLSQSQKGSVEAQFRLGMLYKDGKKVPKDSKIAFQHFLNAGKANYSPAQYQLALIYQQGEGVPKDEKESMAWLIKAGNNGNPEALMKLGRFYEKGVSGKPDYVQAYRWYSKGQTSPFLVELRHRLANQMTSAQLKEAENKLREK